MIYVTPRELATQRLGRCEICHREIWVTKAEEEMLSKLFLLALNTPSTFSTPVYGERQVIPLPKFPCGCERFLIRRLYRLPDDPKFYYRSED